MSAKLEYKSGEIRVFFDGELDHHAASLLRVSIDNAVSQRRPKTRKGSSTCRCRRRTVRCAICCR